MNQRSSSVYITITCSTIIPCRQHHNRRTKQPPLYSPSSVLRTRLPLKPRKKAPQPKSHQYGTKQPSRRRKSPHPIPHEHRPPRLPNALPMPLPQPHLLHRPKRPPPRHLAHAHAHQHTPQQTTHKRNNPTKQQLHLHNSIRPTALRLERDARARCSHG